MRSELAHAVLLSASSLAQGEPLMTHDLHHHTHEDDPVRQTRKDFFVAVAQIWLAAWLIGLGMMSYAGR